MHHPSGLTWKGFLSVDEPRNSRGDVFSQFSSFPYPHPSSRDICSAPSAHVLSFANASPSYSYLASSQSCFNPETIAAFRSVYSIDPNTHSLVYKPVARKVRTVPDSISEDFHITRRLPDNPLEGLLDLPVHPPEFTPGVRYTQERANALDLDPAKWLWPEELKLLQWIVCTHKLAFIWDASERGRFKEEHQENVILLFLVLFTNSATMYTIWI